MGPPTAVARERTRLAALGRYRILDGPPEPDLQTVAELAAQLCQVPTVMLNIIDDAQQHLVATVGIEPMVCGRDESMCAVTMEAPGQIVVRDATRDPRFAANPFVTGDIRRFRFYAASHLRTPDGYLLGTLCVFDDTPRELTPGQRAGLDRLARVAVDVLELRRHGYRVAELLREQERTTDALDEANGALRAANELLRGFAEQLTHDLRTPLTSIQAHAADLHSTSAAGDAPARHSVDRLAAAAQRMGDLIEGVLSHCTEAPPPASVVDLAEVAAEVTADLDAPVRDCGAAVVLRPLPAVVGDRTEWRILLQNLIGNAVKYRHPARLSRVEVSGCAGRDQVWVAVADNGIGIPADQRHLVTRPYARLGPDRGDSHGIGLATCARITAAHGGRLEFADNPGGGTVARITMPARRR